MNLGARLKLRPQQMFQILNPSDIISTVLLRPYVQGVLRVTPHVHLIRCSDRDIMGD